MALKKIGYSLSLLMLLTACNSKQVKKENIEENLTTQIESTPTIKKNIISKPILINKSIHNITTPNEHIVTKNIDNESMSHQSFSSDDNINGETINNQSFSSDDNINDGTINNQSFSSDDNINDETINNQSYTIETINESINDEAINHKMINHETFTNKNIDNETISNQSYTIETINNENMTHQRFADESINNETINHQNFSNENINNGIVTHQNYTIESIGESIENKAINNSTENTSYGISGDFAGNYKLQNFIQRMVSEHGFDESTLNQLFSEARNTKLMPTAIYERRRNSNCSKSGTWDRYKNMFVYERNIQRGLAFWEKHKNTLNRAYKVYGVLPEYIMGIIGIETAYGTNFGKKKVIDVLTTKAMTGDRREDFYTKQLEKFLIMSKEDHLEPAELMGSDAGAMGYGQFIASSYLDFAVDFNRDGVTDLWNAEDAIGSIANYFSRNGWKRSLKTVAVRAKYRGKRFKKLKTGYKTKYSQYKLRKKYHIVPRKKLNFNGQVSLIKLPKYSYDELWLGTHNFRVITTYNHSAFYGMAVHHLAKAVRKRRYGR